MLSIKYINFYLTRFALRINIKMHWLLHFRSSKHILK